MKDNQSSSKGAGFCSMLCVAFIVLKLIGTITWSWWWVLAPIWMPIAFLLFIAVVMLVVSL